MNHREWPKDKCMFLKLGEPCPNPPLAKFFFCEHHQIYFAPISNQDLLEMQAKATVETLEVKEKIFHLKQGIAVWDDFYNIWHELIQRGYSNDSIIRCTSQVIENKQLFADFKTKMGSDPTWKKFEKIIAGIHHLTSEGAEVKLDEKVVGRRTGGNRQIDVSVRFKQGLYEHFIIVECKDYNKPVSIDRVEALRTKMEDVGANKAVIVSKKGFQKGAQAAAEAYNIELYVLEEERTDWTKKIVEEVKELPFPVAFAFDTPRMPQIPRSETGLPSNLEDVLIRQSEIQKPRSLKEIAIEVAEAAFKNHSPLPCEIYVQFSEDRNPWQILLPAYNHYIPIYGITIQLEPHRWVTRIDKIDIPPQQISYIYSDIKKKAQYKFRVEDVKKAIETF